MRARLFNYNLQIVFAICVAVALLSFGLDKELSINLLTEIGGVALTVFVINNILNRKERQRRISIDQRILRELQLIIASYYSIWKHLYWQYSRDLKLNNARDFIKVYPELISRTNLQDRFEVISIQHPESWGLFFYNRSIKECFENYRAVLIQAIQTFINDFKMYIEPELLDILLSILESQYIKDLMLMSEESTTMVLEEIGQDTSRLESFLKPTNTQHIQLVMTLIEYSKSLNKIIGQFKESNVELYELSRYIPHPSKFDLRS